MIEHDPDTKIAAAAFLGLEGAVDLGSLEQVVDVAAYKGFNRCPVLVCPEVKVNGVRRTYYKFCANPSKFYSKGRHFCGVHRLTFKNHPGALEEGRIFDCKTDVFVCSRVYGMGMAGPRILFE
jgi:hypothetical protein